MNKNRGMDMEEQPKRDNTLLIVLMIVAICFLLVQLGMKIAYYQELSEQASEASKRASERASQASERSKRASERSKQASERSKQASERLERTREEFKKKWGEYP